MKLSKEKRKQIEKKGKDELPPIPGGGAMGRLRQFEQERGLEESELRNPATDESCEEKSEKDRPSKKGS